MSELTAPQLPVVAVGDVWNGAVSFARQLDSGETLTGTPTVTEETTSDLTISNVAVSTSSLRINSTLVAAGTAVQFKVVGQTSGTYTLKITATTTSTPAQTLVRYVKFMAKSE